VAAGSWPLWNPWRSFGQPLLADPNNQVLYPTTWLYLVVAPARLQGPLVLAHLLAAGLGTHALGRRLGLSRGGAFTAAALWMLSGPLLSVVHTFNVLFAAAWMPWVLLLADRALAGRGMRGVLAWAAALALQLFAGSPDVSAWTGLLCAGLTAARAGRSLAGWRAALARAVPAALLFAALGAVQWWPALEAAAASARWQLGAEARGYWSFHPAASAELLVPVRLHQLPLRADARARLYESRDPFLRSALIGLPAMVLAAAGLLCGRARARGLLAAAAVLALLFALGRHTPAQELLAALVPPLRLLRYPEKALVLLAFATALLAGAGHDAWRRSLDHGRRFRALAAGAGLAGVLGLVLAAGLAADARLLRELLEAAPPPAAAARVAGFAALGLALAGLGLARRPGSAVAGAWVATVLAVGGLCLTHDGLNRTGPREVLTLRPAALDALRSSPAPRVYVYDYLYADASLRRLGRAEPFAPRRVPPGWSAAEAQALATRDYLFPPSASAWGVGGSFDLDFANTYPVFLDELVRTLRQVEDTPGEVQLLRLAGVTHALALHPRALPGLEPASVVPSLLSEPIRVFEVTQTRPRVFLATRTIEAPRSGAIPRLLDPRLELSRDVVIEAPARPERDGRALPGPADPGWALIGEERPDALRLEVQSASPAWLVLLDTWDRGWTATLDGLPVPIARADQAFRAVAIPPGRHVVEQRYRPTSAVGGAALSALAWVLGAFAYARARSSSSAA